MVRIRREHFKNTFNFEEICVEQCQVDLEVFTGGKNFNIKFHGCTLTYLISVQTLNSDLSILMIKEKNEGTN